MDNAKMKFAPLLVAAALTLSLGACKVEKTDDGELPKVDVEATGGDLPNYDVKTPDVDVTTEQATVAVPEVDVTTKETTVPVPNVDVTLPSDQEQKTETPQQ